MKRLISCATANGHTGGYDAKPCICTRNCPAICDGRCGCEACAKCFVDNGLDEKLGNMYHRGTKQ